jgi:hypothetical protein
MFPLALNNLVKMLAEDKLSSLFYGGAIEEEENFL